MFQKIPINKIIGLFKINFEDYPFLSWSPLLIHHLISDQDNIQNLSPLDKSTLGQIDGVLEDFTQTP